jgi:MOSC domain-containing protein YiiM
MNLVSVNVGLPRVVPWKGIEVETGIFKEPVAGAVQVKKLNLAGDRQADLRVHGGTYKAVYGYPAEHYPFWREAFPEMELPCGSFGENLTTEGLSETTLCVGDRVRAGSALLMVTQPRMPCYKLAMKFDRDDMIKRFLASERSGFYFAVMEEGEVEAGSNIEWVSHDPQQVRIVDILRMYLGHTRDRELFARALRAEGLPESWKEGLREKAG